MVRKRQPARGRRAAAAVEMAVVSSVGLLFLFGVFEYGRLLMVRQLLDNAAREGARYAVVHTYDTTVVADTQQRVRTVLGGQDGQLKNFTVQVFKADGTGANVGPPTDAAFGEYIAVQVDGDYSPVMPSFLFMGQTVHLKAEALMYSEAN
jgi:Flp pilus assembly protein TadG